MARRRFGPEQVVTKLRHIEVLMDEGKSLHQAVREAGITDTIHDRWRKECGGLKANQVN